MITKLRETIKQAFGPSESEKVSKETVKYSGGHKNSKCGLCIYFNKNETCDKVKGKVLANMWCTLFKKK